MIHKGGSHAHIVVERNHLRQNGSVACLADISGGSGDQPERIVIEAAADIGISLLGKRLVLMVCAAILELRRCNVDDTLSCTVGDQMHEAEQILTGIAEAHAAADTGLVVGSRTRHVKCHHTLILVPGIYHAVHLLVAGGNRVLGEQLLPISL